MDSVIDAAIRVPYSTSKSVQTFSSSNVGDFLILAITTKMALTTFS